MFLNVTLALGQLLASRRPGGVEEEEVKEEEDRQSSPQGSVRPWSLRSLALA